MSSLTIMAIAVDRYRIIVHSHLRQVSQLLNKKIPDTTMQVGPCGAWLLLPIIFLVSCVLSGTIYVKTELHSLATILVR